MIAYVSINSTSPKRSDRRVAQEVFEEEVFPLIPLLRREATLGSDANGEGRDSRFH